MYGEALRNWGAFLAVLAIAFGTASAIAYVAAGRWLRTRLEAEYGKVCALPREAWGPGERQAEEAPESPAEREAGQR